MSDTLGDVQRIPIARFDMRKLKSDRVILILGKRGTGKSTLMKDILSHLYREFDCGIAVSPTGASIDDFREYIPDSCIYDEYEDHKIEEILDMLDTLNMGETINNEVVKRFPKVFVLLDDCMFDKKILKTKSMKYLHNNGRHKKILLVNVAQYAMDIPRDIRSQIDYVFVLRETRLNLRQTLHKEFFPFEHFEDTCQALDKFTNDRGCIVIDSTSTSNRIEDQVFYYKAQTDLPSFILGNRDYWKLHYHYYKPKVRKFGDGGCPIPGLQTRHGGSRIRPSTQQEKDKNAETAANKAKKKGALILEKVEPPLAASAATPCLPAVPHRLHAAPSNVSQRPAPSVFSQHVAQSIQKKIVPRQKPQPLLIKSRSRTRAV